MRAYYRDTSLDNLSLPHDSGRSVSEQELRALGFKFWTLEGTDSECMDKHRNHAEELGFTDGSAQEYLWEFKDNKAGAPGAPDMTVKEKLEMVSKELIIQSGKMTLVLDGMWYCDVKDPRTDSFIRMLIEPRDQFFSPPGTIVQFHPHPDTLYNTTVLDIFKTTRTFDQQQPFTPGHDLHEHPLRVAYLESIGTA